MLKRALKKLYDAVPFKQPIYTALRKLVRLPEPIYRHLHFKGVIEVPVTPEAGFKIMHHGYMIENELFWKGIHGWEPISIELWIRLSQQARTIFDIGANTGVYALTSKAVNPDATVIAVEPVKRIYDSLQANVGLNLGQIHTVYGAASDHTGKAILYDIPDSPHLLSVSLNPEWNKGSTRLRPVEVPCITVTDMMYRFGLHHVDLLKIDVETHEPAVLRGFKDILERDRPSLLIEILNDEVAAKVSALLEGLGYAYYNIDDKTWPPEKTDRLQASRHFNFLVCRPEVASSIGL